MSAIERFEFQNQPVRVVVINGVRWAVAADICAALDIKDVSSAMSRLDAADKMLLRRSDTPDSTRGIWDAFAPQVQAVGLVSEDGATDLVLESRKPEARRFRRFLTHEVWPAVRDTGMYSALPQQQLPAIPQTYAEALRLAADEHERAEIAEARYAEIEPSAEAWDRLYELGGDVEVGDAAKILSRDPAISIGRNRLFEFMYEQDWIFRGRHNSWKAYQDQVDLGRLKHRPGEEYWCKKTERYRVGDPTVLVTPKGIAELRRLLGGTGQLELVAS